MRQILCERRQLRSKWQHPPLTLATVIGLNIAIEAFKSQHWWDLGALIAWIVVVSTVAYRPPSTAHVASGVSVEGACEAKAPRAPTTTPPATPPPPTPALRGNLQPAGVFQFTNCFDAFASCTFTESAQCRHRLRGAVAGTVRLLNALGVQVGATRQWALPTQQIVVVGETVPYFVTFVPAADAAQVVDYLVTPAWVDTPCF
jgi:hypothetical protein